MIVETSNLHKTFGNHEALRGLDIRIPEGSAFALIGANGAGKTTTIKILMNLLTPSAGSATVLGTASHLLSPRELTQIGYVSENQEMPGRLTAGQYLDYLRPFYPTWDRELERVLLGDLRLPLERRIRELSHGMRLKLALACALPFRPRLLVLDEPFSGLDPLVRDEFMQEMLHKAADTTILISSHELTEIEGVVTHVAFIDKGRLLFQESIEQLAGRLREVHVTLEHEATLPAKIPADWLQVRTVGNVVSFVSTHFEDETLSARLGAVLVGIRRVEVQPIALRSMFITLARAARDGGHP
jgi:ABC-2 type transport system ATP-binding protein